jgi:hypothetical protein
MELRKTGRIFSARDQRRSAAIGLSTGAWLFFILSEMILKGCTDGPF